MATPKRRTSRTKRDKRRSHYKIDTPTIAACSNCGSAKLFHRVCPECGFYRGKQAVEVHHDFE